MTQQQALEHDLRLVEEIPLTTFITSVEDGNYTVSGYDVVVKDGIGKVIISSGYHEKVSSEIMKIEPRPLSPLPFLSSVNYRSKYRKGTHPNTAHRRTVKSRNAAKAAKTTRKRNR